MMKRTLLVIAALAVMFPLTLAADLNQDQNQNRNQNQNQNQDPDGETERHRNRCSLAGFLPDLPWEELDEREVADLTFMREEEKLARDVYISLYEDPQSNLKIFRQIARSEKTHMRAVLYHLRKYELPDPAAGNGVGVFSNPDLQQLYDDLVLLGLSSRDNALRVGATVEEVDILDLRQTLHRTDNVDLRTLYQNLLKGSRNHLRAFHKTMTRLGVEYQPQVLEPEDYYSIVTSPKEKGVVDADGEYLCGGKGNRLGAG